MDLESAINVYTYIIHIALKINPKKKMHLLSKIHVAVAINKVFCQIFQTSLRTIQDLSIVTIRECALS